MAERERACVLPKLYGAILFTEFMADSSSFMRTLICCRNRSHITIDNLWASKLSNYHAKFISHRITTEAARSRFMLQLELSFAMSSSWVMSLNALHGKTNETIISSFHVGTYTNASKCVDEFCAVLCIPFVMWNDETSENTHGKLTVFSLNHASNM